MARESESGPSSTPPQRRHGKAAVPATQHRDYWITRLRG